MLKYKYMFYIVKSNSNYIKQQLINQIMKKMNDILEEDILLFDFDEEKNLNKVFLEYSAINFFGNKKLIIVKNSNFLNKVKIEKDIEEKINKMFEIKNNNSIIFVIDKINKTGKIIKKNKNKFDIYEKDSPQKNELTKYIKNFFDSNQIKYNNSVIKKINLKVGNEFDILNTELKKIIILNPKIVDDEFVDRAVIDLSRENLFKLAECVLTLNENNVSFLINKLREQGENFYIIGEQLSLEFSRVLRYKILREKYKLKDNEIQWLTKWNVWSMKNYTNWINNWSSIKKMNDFYYDIILKKCFIDIINSNDENSLETLKKILVTNIINIKRENLL